MRLCADLDRFGFAFDLAPGDGLVRPGARVTAVILLRCNDDTHRRADAIRPSSTPPSPWWRTSIYVDGVVGAVAHEVGVARVVLGQPPAQYDHARPTALDRTVVNGTDVAYHVQQQTLHAAATQSQGANRHVEQSCRSLD